MEVHTVLALPLGGTGTRDSYLKIYKELMILLTSAEPKHVNSVH